MYYHSLIPRPSLNLPAFNVVCKKHIKSGKIERGPGDKASIIIIMYRLASGRLAVKVTGIVRRVNIIIVMYVNCSNASSSRLYPTVAAANDILYDLCT